MIDGEPEPLDQPTDVQVLPDAESYGFAAASGIFCPLRDLGEKVEAGQPAAAIYDIKDPLRAPVTMAFRRSGLLWAMRGQGRVEKGGAAAVVVTSWQQDAHGLTPSSQASAAAGAEQRTAGQEAAIDRNAFAGDVVGRL